MGNIIKTELYDGSLESAELVLKRLNVTDDKYHFNINTRQLVIIKYGLILKPGDYYQFLVHEEFKAI